MRTILSDKNCEGHATAIFHVLRRVGWVDLLDIRLAKFKDIGLVQSATDEEVWKLCQQETYLLITGNRTTADGDHSLEIVMQRFYSEDILPVLTIGDLERVLKEQDYCDGCADAIAQVLFNLDLYRGIPRLYIPFPQ